MAAGFASSIGMIGSVEQIQGLEGKALLAVHNEISNAAVKKFSDKKTGVKRTVAAFLAWQEQQTGKPPRIVTGDQKSYRKDSNRGKVIELASKAGGATFKTLMSETGWDEAQVKAALARIESYNGLTVNKSGEGEDTNVVITGVIRSRKPFDYAPKAEQKDLKPGSKRAKVAELCKVGATFDQIKGETGWDDRTAYEGIRLIHAFSGYGIKETGDGLIKIYK